MGKRILGLAALICVAAAITVVPVAAAAPPVRLSFEKQATAEPGVWSGTVSGDIDGDLTTRLITLDNSEPVWQVSFDWIVDAGQKSFTARLSGTLDTTTGAVAMKGSVIQGYLLGTKVRERGQLVDQATSAFEGTIRIQRQGHGR